MDFDLSHVAAVDMIRFGQLCITALTLLVIKPLFNLKSAIKSLEGEITSLRVMMHKDFVSYERFNERLEEIEVRPPITRRRKNTQGQSAKTSKARSGANQKEMNNGR